MNAMPKIMSSHLFGTGGRFVTVEAYKLDGSYRRFNGKVIGSQYVPLKGLLVKFQETNGNIRSFYVDRVEQLNAEKVRIEVPNKV